LIDAPVVSRLPAHPSEQSPPRGSKEQASQHRFPFRGPSPSCLQSASFDASVLKNVHKLPVAVSDLGHSGLPRDLLVPPSNERLPEVRAANSETYEPRHSGRRHQLFAHLFVVLAAAQDDAADFVTAGLPRSSNNFPAVLTAIESLDLPDIWLDMRVKELKHEQAATLAMQVVRQPVQAGPTAGGSVPDRPPGCSAPAPCRSSGGRPRCVSRNPPRTRKSNSSCPLFSAGHAVT
jgi:hypothetical protein